MTTLRCGFAWVIAATTFAVAAGQGVSREQVISFYLFVPADAVVEVDGNKTQSTGESRGYQTPPVLPGSTYKYTLKVTSKGTTITRVINLRHDAKNTLDLRSELAPVKGKDQPKTLGTIERLDPAFDKLVPPGAKLEILASGFIWTEGPVWIKDGGFLAFSDIPNNVVNKWDGKKITPYVKPSGYTGKKPRGGKPGDEPGSNGLMLDAQGRLTLCEHGDRRVTRIEKDGTKTVLADKYMGKRLNSPNDLVYHSNGALYFTDPPYGMEKGWDDSARELDFCGVYRLSKDGKLTLLTKEMTRPNGITLSPDEKTLYVANSDPEIAVWKAFPVKTDGTLGVGKVFFDSTPWVGKKKGLPDGMKVDQAGNLFATGPGGVLVFSPEGKHLGTIATGVNTANCAFGEDGMTLFVAADHDICKIRLSTKGNGF